MSAQAVFHFPSHVRLVLQREVHDLDLLLRSAPIVGTFERIAGVHDDHQRLDGFRTSTGRRGDDFKGHVAVLAISRQFGDAQLDGVVFHGQGGSLRGNMSFRARVAACRAVQARRTWTTAPSGTRSAATSEAVLL